MEIKKLIVASFVAFLGMTQEQVEASENSASSAETKSSKEVQIDAESGYPTGSGGDREYKRFKAKAQKCYDDTYKQEVEKVLVKMFAYRAARELDVSKLTLADMTFLAKSFIGCINKTLEPRDRLPMEE